MGKRSKSGSISGKINSKTAARKVISFFVLLFFNFNLFSGIIPDPVSIGNTRVTRTASGVDQLDIATPNMNGTSYNSLRELQVSEQGLIVNNSKHVVVETQIAGLVARNRNLDNGIAANLIITEVTGKDRTSINGYVEVAGQRADLVVANRNGISVNGGGFLNADRVTLTTGGLRMQDGNLVSVDVEEGHISIAGKGVDALSLTDLELLSKTVDISGIIKASDETRLLISAGSQTYEYRTKEVRSKGKTYSGIAVDGRSAGSMYAGRIDIISNDRGAGVNTEGDLVSVDDITLTADGDITTGKTATDNTVRYTAKKKVRIKGETAAGKRVAVKAKEVEIDAKVITGFLEESLGKEAFTAEAEKVAVTGKGNIASAGKVDIRSRLTGNSGEIYSAEKVEVHGEKLDNTGGEIGSQGQIGLEVSETVNVRGYILSDGLQKEDVDKEEDAQASSGGMTLSDIGVVISGNLDNREGVIRGREVSVGGDISGNSGGKIESSGTLVLGGREIDNRKGLISGNIGRLETVRLINEGGRLISSGSLEGTIKEIGNREGILTGVESVRIAGERLDNLRGQIGSYGSIGLDIDGIDNSSGYILSDGITREEADSWAERKVREGISDSSGAEPSGDGIAIRADRLENVKGIIASLNRTEIIAGKITNRGGEIVSGGTVEVSVPGEYVYEGNVYGDISTRIEGKTVTVDEAVIRDNALYLIGKESINLGKDITAGILGLETGGDIDNRNRISGTESLSVEAGNISNSGIMLSGGSLYIGAGGRIYNGEGGRIEGAGDIHMEGSEIENVRGEILSGGSLALIADTLIRNSLGKIYSGGGIYGEVKDGHFENAGESGIVITERVRISEEPLEKERRDWGKAGNPVRSRQVETTERELEITSEGSGITSDGSIVLNIEGDVINRDGGNIGSGKSVQIRAGNVYNTGKYLYDTGSSLTGLGAGGEITGSDVYLEVSGKVVNGTEEYLSGTYRRDDGVLIDSRKVSVLKPSHISGTSGTVINAGELLNTSQIGTDTGTVYISTGGQVTNASIGDTGARISGSEVYIDGKGGIHNIGGKIEGISSIQLISENGKVLNESTADSVTKYRENRKKNRFFPERNIREVESVTESIRNIGIMSSGGTAYIGGKDIENVAGSIQGAEGTYLKAENDIDDRTVNLRYRGNNITEVTRGTKEVIDWEAYERSSWTALRRYEMTGRYPTRQVEADISTTWNTIERSNTVSGIIGNTGNTVLEAGRNLTLESSDIRSREGDIVLNARNHLMMLSTVDTEYKYRTHTYSHGSKLKKKTTTETWVVDNAYADNVDLTAGGSILMNYHGAGAPADNMGVFAQGVNFSAGGHVLGLSDGDIYIQGTKDRLESLYNSHTTKRFMGVRYGNSSSNISVNQEKYRLSQLYGEAGMEIDSEGRLRIEGSDIRSVGSVFLRGKLGVEVVHGMEESTRYEEHRKSGLTGSLGISWSGASAGVGYGKSETKLEEKREEVVPNILNVGGNVTIESDEGDVEVGPTSGWIGGKLTLTGKDIGILDAVSRRRIDQTSRSSYIGVGVSVGIPVIGAAQQLWEAGKSVLDADSTEGYLNAGFGAFNAGMSAANAFGNHLFNNQIGFSGGINFSNNSSSYYREEEISVGSNIYVASGVEYNGDSLHTRGLNIRNDGDTIYNIAGNILKEAGKSTVREESESTGFGLSLARGMLDSNGTVNPLRMAGTTLNAGVSRQSGDSEAVYYSDNKDITEGNSHYNVGGEVRISGTDVSTGSISGKAEGDFVTESLQDMVSSNSEGYSFGVSVGIRPDRSGNGIEGYLSSISAGYSKSEAEQRVTRNVSEFTVGSGILEVAGKVRQTGSLIDGSFVLNAGGYEKKDLHDVDRSSSYGINVTYYPGVSYTRRDSRGKAVLDENGMYIKDKGGVYGIGLSYASKDKSREILATMGAGVSVNFDVTGVNRDVSAQTGEWEGKEISPINISPGTEYWLTRAGVGKARDILESAERSAEGIYNILTGRWTGGEVDLLRGIVAESVARKSEERGYIPLGKTAEEFAEAVEKRYGDMTKKGIRVRFYGKGDIEVSELTSEQISKLEADGFATTGDGYIWLNSDKLNNGDVIDINAVVQHELTHQILGKDTEYEASYVENSTKSFLQGIREDGYLEDGEIIGLKEMRLTDEDLARLNSYKFEDMEYRIFINKDDRDEILRELQKLINYKLDTKKCSLKQCEVIIKTDKATKDKIEYEGNMNKKLEKGNELIKKLILDKKSVLLSFSDGKTSKALEISNEGKKSYQVLIDRLQKPIASVWYPHDKKFGEQEIPLFIVIGHELIHISHYFDGSHSEQSDGFHWTVDKYGRIYRDEYYGTGEREEYRTVGIGNHIKDNAELGVETTGIYNLHKDDITENWLRLEQGLPLRRAYYTILYIGN